MQSKQMAKKEVNNLTPKLYISSEVPRLTSLESIYFKIVKIQFSENHDS